LFRIAIVFRKRRHPNLPEFEDEPAQDYPSPALQAARRSVL
jgi:hypothetical protein